MLAALLSIAVALTIWRASPYARVIAAAAPASRGGNVRRRLSGVLEAVGLHRRLLQRPLSGVIHALIFCSFFVLFTAILDAFGSGFFPGFSLRNFGGDTWIGLLQDVFAVLMSVGVGMAAYQRFVLRPQRFEGSNQSRRRGDLCADRGDCPQHAHAGGLRNSWRRALWMATGVGAPCPRPRALRHSGRGWRILLLLGAHYGDPLLSDLYSRLEAPPYVSGCSERLPSKLSAERPCSRASGVAETRRPDRPQFRSEANSRPAWPVRNAADARRPARHMRPACRSAPRR